MAAADKKRSGTAEPAEYFAFVPGDEVEAAPAAGRRELTLRQLIALLWRRKMLIIGTVVLGTGLAVLAVRNMTPIYGTEARIVLEPARANIAGGSVENVVRGLNPDIYTSETEAEVLMSRSLAVQVVDRLDLTHNPLFNPSLEPEEKGLIDSLLDAIPESWLAVFRSDQEDEKASSSVPELSPEQREAWLRDEIADNFLQDLFVDTSLRSRVLFIHYSSPDPEMAALAANTVADVYILDQLNAKYEAAERANAWLSDRVNELRQRVEASSKALEDYRRQAGIIEIGGTDVFTQQLAELNSQLIDARNKYSETKARYDQVQGLLASPDGIETAAAVLESPLIQQLRGQETEVVRKIAELKTQVREEHPKMQLAVSELQDLREKINTEVKKIVINLGNELEIAKVRVDNLETEVAKLSARINERNQAEITLHELQAVSDTDRELYETVLARFKEVDVQQRDIIQPDARVISYAAVPGSPSKPNKKLIVTAALLISAIFGVALAFLRENLDFGFRTLEQLEAVTGMPTIGLVPRLGKLGGKAAAADFVIEKPHSAFAESLRTLRTALLLSNVDRPPKLVLFASAVPGEGKSLTALAAGRAAAKSGQRVLLLDCDLRKPSLHEILEVPNEVGLVQYLAHERSLEDIVQLDFKSGMHYVVSGPRVPNPSDILASDQMRELLRAVAGIYDLVLIDSPPVLAVSDSLVLARLADVTIFLVRWEKTRREATVSAVKRLRETGATIAGLVLTQVDTRKHDRYYNREISYYHREYDKYYVE